ncbi:MAG: DUF1573 domain-containing protein [Bacteroidota bacterium]|nr:DUF1573 domain-containing protein [Bacteroidota bacterium]
MKSTNFLILSVSIFFWISCKDRIKDPSDKNSDKENPYLEVIQNPATADNPKDSSRLAKIEFQNIRYDFGTITDLNNVGYVFFFRNSGNVKLLISNVETSCGCTTTQYPTGFISPGDTNSIQVRFDASGRSGRQEKTIKVLANTEPPQTVLYLTGNIISKK